MSLSGTGMGNGRVHHIGIISLVMALVSSVLLGAAAHADEFGTYQNGAGPFADNANHQYCFGVNFNDALNDEANYAMNNLSGSTVMTDEPVSCGLAGRDVRWLDANLPGDTRGQYVCTNLSGSICFEADVTLDPAEINEGANDHEDTQKTACHEVGHSVGLQHGDTKTDCMINGPIPDTTAQWRTYNQHHKDHINTRYG